MWYFIDISWYETCVCKRALSKFILYFVLCFEVLKRKKTKKIIAVVVLTKKNLSPLMKTETPLWIKNLQNLKMYIQKYRQSKTSLWEMFKKLSLLFIRIVHKHWVVFFFFFLLLNIILYFLLYFNTLCTDPEIKLWKRFVRRSHALFSSHAFSTFTDS